MPTPKKIRDMVKQIGGSAELADSLLEGMDAYLQEREQQLNEEFQSRIKKAKVVCYESTEKFKVDLARKVEVFLEARVNAVTREAQKNAAIGESENSRTLTAVKRLLEGVNLELPEAQAAEENKKLRVKIAKLVEGKRDADSKAARATGIAKKLMELNQNLREGKLTQQPKKAPKKNVNEDAPKGKKTLKNLQEDAVSPKTTQKTNVGTLPIPGKQQQTVSNDSAINDIANAIDDEAAYVK